MQRYRLLMLFLLSVGVPAQTPDSAAENRALRDAKHRYMFVATKAAGLFHSFDSVEQNLAADGATIHPTTGTLRLRIEGTLREAESALADRDVKSATLETKLAEELVSRLAKRVGGE